jgi:uncharacterized protein (TIGR02186 family)
MPAGPRIAAAALALFLATPAFAQDAEEIQADISAREIAIESNFTGHRVVVFGAVENYPRDAIPGRIYDVVVAIRGPSESVVTWRKRKTAGVWLNREARLFPSAPGFYATLSTRPLDQIATSSILKEYGLGFANLDVGEARESVTASREAAFRAALVRLMARDGLYQAHRYGVNFVGGGLFRGTVDLPANVPVGDFVADVFLFRDGRFVARTESHFSIGKEGIERAITRLATEDPVVYGFIAILLGFGIGLAASFMSRD